MRAKHINCEEGFKQHVYHYGGTKGHNPTIILKICKTNKIDQYKVHLWLTMGMRYNDHR